jgi:hypothetical protein
VVALILRLETCTSSGTALRCDSFRCTAGTRAGPAKDVVVALAIRIEIGSRCGQDNHAGRGTSATACGQSAACRKPGACGNSASLNRVCRQSGCCRAAGRAYWKSACRDTRACAGIFSAGHESGAYSRAGNAARKARSKGSGYSALARSRIERIARHQVVGMLPVGKRFHPAEPSGDVFVFGGNVEAELLHRVVGVSAE